MSMEKLKAINMQRLPRNDRIQEWRDQLFTALGFLTRLPVPLPDRLEPGAVIHALRFSPAVGAFAGAFAGAFYWLAISFGFSTFIAALFGIVAGALLTGGLHEEALSDMADGFSRGWTAEKKLEIMSDGRIGAHGALVLILSLLLRVGAMAQLSSPDSVMAALITAGALSRAIMYAAMYALPPARSTGLAHDAGQPAMQQMATALTIGAVIAWLAVPFGAALAAFIAAGAGGFFTARMAKQHIGGQTGDILGAIQQISEICAMLLLAALLTL